METDALDTALRTHDGVLSLGGGAPLAPDNQELLAGYAAGGGLVVFLDVAPDVAVARMGDVHGRPLLEGDPRARFVELMAARREVYELVATLHLDTSEHTPDDVVDLVVAHLPPIDQGGLRMPPVG
jgi:shikimate kinase